MDFKEKIIKINQPGFADKRIQQLKYLMYDALGYTPNELKINLKVRPSFSSQGMRGPNGEKLIVDYWNVESYFSFSLMVDPQLSEIGYLISELNNKITKLFSELEINQFLDIKKRSGGDYSIYPIVLTMNFDSSGVLNLEMFVDYETAGVEEAGDL